MSLKAIVRGFAVAAMMGCLALSAGCTVRPLMATSVAPGGAARDDLGSIAVEPVGTRHAQQVRNQLVFLLNRGAGQPADPRYSLALGVRERTMTAARVQIATEQEPTASLVQLTGTYRLTDSRTGAVIAEGERQISSAFDNPRQEYAAFRAERDAQDRAARELAEAIHLALAQDLSRASNRQ